MVIYKSDNVDDLYRLVLCARMCIGHMDDTVYVGIQSLQGYKMADLSLKMSENAVTLERQHEVENLGVLAYSLLIYSFCSTKRLKQLVDSRHTYPSCAPSVNNRHLSELFDLAPCTDHRL